jgi:hypothetical protein
VSLVRDALIRLIHIHIYKRIEVKENNIVKNKGGRPLKGSQRRDVPLSLKVTKTEAKRIELLQTYLNLINPKVKLSRTDLIVRAIDDMFNVFEDGILQTLKPNYEAQLRRIYETS